MPYYRLYFFEDSHIRHVVEMICGNDDEAIALVETHRDGREMQLWQQARRVQEFASIRAAPASARKPNSSSRRATSAAGLEPAPGDRR